MPSGAVRQSGSQTIRRWVWTGRLDAVRYGNKLLVRRPDVIEGRDRDRRAGGVCVGRVGGATSSPRTRPPDRSAMLVVDESVVVDYRVGGLGSAYVCSRCMLRLRLKRSAMILVRDYFGFPLIAFVYALGLLSVGYLGYAALTGADTEGTGSWWFLVGLGVIPVVVYMLVFVFNPVARVGELAAIELHRKQLESQGWHTFWPSKEYAKLGPERPSFSG